jgi:peptidoglycan hydrolase-like protein with peptidoglycan-binding domain
VKQGKAGAIVAPYTQMAHSGIVAIGVQVDGLPDQGVAFLQAALIRLGLDPGRIDGVIGPRTQGAMQDAGLDPNDPAGFVSQRLKQQFPGEF